MVNGLSIVTKLVVSRTGTKSSGLQIPSPGLSTSMMFKNTEYFYSLYSSSVNFLLRMCPLDVPQAPQAPSGLIPLFRDRTSRERKTERGIHSFIHSRLETRNDSILIWVRSS